MTSRIGQGLIAALLTVGFASTALAADPNALCQIKADDFRSKGDDTNKQADTRLVVHVIVASNGGGGVAPQLAAYASRLQSQFGQFNQFSLESSEPGTLTSGGSMSVSTPGGTATVQLNANGQLQVSTPGGPPSPAVTLPPGGVHMQSGGQVSGGTLILVLAG